MIISMGLQVVIKAPILAVWAIAKITSTHWQWSGGDGGSRGIDGGG